MAVTLPLTLHNLSHCDPAIPLESRKLHDYVNPDSATEVPPCASEARSQKGNSVSALCTSTFNLEAIRQKSEYSEATTLGNIKASHTERPRVSSLVDSHL